MSKVILITGSSSGFGRLAAETLARRGHTVYASMRAIAGKNAPRAQELRDLALAENLSLFPIELEVTEDRSIEAAVAEIVRREDRLDVVVNNAGVASFGLTEAFDLDEVRQIFDTNVYGPLRVNRAALPQLRKQGRGLLIHVSSMMGRLVVPSAGLYAASKFALEAIAESLRYELVGLGIDSTIIQPGAFPTAIFGKVGAPRDTTVTESYGEVGHLAANLAAGIESSLSGDDAPDPQDVADAIVAAVDAEPGQVPLRTPVGADSKPATVVNSAAEKAQAALFSALGLERFLAALPASRRAA